MNKQILLVGLFIFAVASGILFFTSIFSSDKTKTINPTIDVPFQEATSFKDAEYNIAGTIVKLVDGNSIINDGVSTITTNYFGNELYKDLNGDGVDDVVFLVTQETVGTGIFFYVLAALKTETGYVGSEAYFIGDRIAPQTTESGPGKMVIVNYADRSVSESYVIQPSIGETLQLILDVPTMQFGEVVANFEGEANPEVMSIGMKTWKWIKINYLDGKEVIPVKQDVFSITFNQNSEFSVTTDCNVISGFYVLDGQDIRFKNIVSTLMYCEDSQESLFSDWLSKIEKFEFTSKGELILYATEDLGTMTFR